MIKGKNIPIKNDICLMIAQSTRYSIDNCMPSKKYIIYFMWKNPTHWQVKFLLICLE